ncbi:MAG: lysophospholipid acyltransferase family protein [Steroidobacteraceae bacterium]|nr:lysophospholipid acyltransferase family protein [Steroidobacteraceae bacterium]MDW8260569.1 lysophospholipid acyltransferase family protein [Gammaproteobacteria bacterium]
MSDESSAEPLRNTLYRRETRSSRRMTRWRRFGYRLLVPIAATLIRLLWRSCRIVAVVGAEHLPAALARVPAAIPCYWHQHMLFCVKWLLAQPRIKIGFLISPSVDGELGAMLVRRLGGHVIRGSSTHTGARALRDYYDALLKRDISPVITPDGPKGPRFVCKPGAVLLAQMSGRPIVPLAYAASRAWLVQWDKFVIPWPGARIAIAVGAPHYVPRTLSAAGLEAEQQALRARLHELFRSARAALEKAAA